MPYFNAQVMLAESGSYVRGTFVEANDVSTALESVAPMFSPDYFADLSAENVSVGAHRATYSRDGERFALHITEIPPTLRRRKRRKLNC